MPLPSGPQNRNWIWRTRTSLRRSTCSTRDIKIPSTGSRPLLTTQEGTQLAFIDERNSGTQDAGNIDAVVRRKEAGETQFADSVTLIDLPNNGGSAAFTIDMATVQEQESGRIFAFVDMFPESSAL